MKKAALLRFARGLGYAVLASAVAYASVNVDVINEVFPQAAVLVPIITAGLLAADKYLRVKASESA